MERMITKLHLHHHPLLRVDDGKAFVCNFCCTSGSSARYRCEHCNHNIHAFCASCPPIVSSHLHHHPLKLISGYKCSVCSQSLRAQSLDYACDSCNVFTHISCIENVKANNHHHDLAKQIMYRDHKHPLTLADKSVEFICMHCRATGSGRRYACTTLRCKFQVHTFCAREPPQSLRSAIHPQHELKLGCWRMELECQVCFQSVGGASYACKDCGFAIHPSCHEKSVSGDGDDDHPQHPDVYRTPPRGFGRSVSPRWPEDRPGPTPAVGRRERPVDDPHPLRRSSTVTVVRHVDDPHPLRRSPTVVRTDGLYFFMHPMHDLTSTQWGANPGVWRPCAVCGDQATGDCYSCFTCRFDVHEVCAFTRPTTTDAAHPAADHILHFLLSREICCAVCGKECSGWRYYCGLCDVHIHKGCLRGFPLVDRSSSTSGHGYSGASAPYSYGFGYPQ